MAAFHELIKWYGLVDEGVVLCKDGSYIAGWHLEGIDIEPMEQEEMDARTEGLARAVGTFGDADGFWVEFARRPLRHYRTSEKDFEAPVLQEIEAERAAFFESQDANFTNRITLCYHWVPPRALRQWGPEAQEKARRAFALRCRQVASEFGTLYRLERMGLRREVDDHHEIPFRRDALLGRLASSLSGRFCKVNVPDIPIYLDRILAPEWSHPNAKELPLISGRPVAIVAVDGYPGGSSAGMTAFLERLPVEYQWTTRFLPLSRTRAKTEIDTIRRGWGFVASPLRNMLSRDAPPNPSTFAEEMLLETGAALTGLDANDMSFGDFTTVITLFGDHNTSDHKLMDMANGLCGMLRDRGFPARVETLNALEAFLSTLPGHRTENVRGGIVNTLGFADMIPISTIWAGQPTNPSNKFPKNSPALVRGLSASGEPYFFNLHSRDVGHTLVFGPTGSGKSVLLGLIASNFLKYPNAQVFVFDKRRSMYTLTRAIGGRHIELGTEGAPLCPMGAVGDLGLPWALGWVEKLCTLAGLDFTPEVRAEVTVALGTLNPESTAPLQELAAAVQTEAVRQVLERYTKGALKAVVDAPSDDLDLARFTVFETDEMLGQGPGVTVPVLDYIFERIEHRLTGVPTVILLDEAWSFLGHPLFSDRIDSWLRELRKANCALVLATQFTGDALDTRLSGPLIQSCKTRIFLSDPDAKNTRLSEAYKALNLTEAQIDILATMRPARDYYILKPEGRRIVDFCLGPKALSILGATDVEIAARTTRLWQADPGNWWREILEQAS